MQNPDGSMSMITMEKFNDITQQGGRNACRVGDVFRVRRCYFELESISDYGISAKGISKHEYHARKKLQQL